MRRSSLALICLIAFAPPAFAGKKGDTKKAVDLSREAISKYRARKYEEAGDLFLRSYELSARPAQLRNAAKAFEEGGVYQRALSLWERYGKLDGLSRDEQSEAEAHVALIREKQKNEQIAKSAHEAARAAELARQDADAARRAAEEARATNVVETTVTEEPTPPIGGWVLVGAGAVMVVASIALWFIAQDQLSTVDSQLAMLDADMKIIGTTPSALEEDVDRINGQRVASGVLLPVGLSAALGGALWLIFGD
jgi:tetratricopeptide (TPR) repeat protein